MPARRKATGSRAFTVDLPKELPVRRGTGDAWWVDLPQRELRASNLNKTFWPGEGYTKGDLLAYYYNVADLLLPHLERRPLTMKRMPDGVDGDSFYEKTAPSHTPEWVHRCTVLSEDAKEGRIDYLTVDDLETLLDHHGVIQLVAGVRQPTRQPGQFSGNWLRMGFNPRLEELE